MEIEAEETLSDSTEEIEQLDEPETERPDEPETEAAQPESETEDAPDEAEEVEDTEYYSTEEMRDLNQDNIDTSRIPPEMQPLYQAMQAPITRKNQELSDKLKELEQGREPLQEHQEPPDKAKLDEVAKSITLQKLGLETKPEPWDMGYEDYLIELGDTRRDIKEDTNRRETSVKEMASFKSGFDEAQFKEIDNAAEDRMYKLLADPKTRVKGQRIMEAVRTGDTKTVLDFVKETAKTVIGKPSKKAKNSNPPALESPSGQAKTTQKDPSKMTQKEYEAWRNAE